MPTLVPYCLTFNSGLHIGTRGVNLEENGLAIPSDTLFAALVDVWRRQGGDVDKLVEPFVGKLPDPPLLLTSAFPFAGELLFFPRPIDLTRCFSNRTLHDRGKDLKRIRYLSLALLEKWLNAEPLDDYLFPEKEAEEPTKGAAFQGGNLWFSLDEEAKLPVALRRAPGRRHAYYSLRVWSSRRVPRVTVSRITSASTPFHAGKVQFARECGLWFGVQWRAPNAQAAVGTTYQQAFSQSLSLLQDDGLGGERTAGYGAFKYKEMPALHLANDPKPGEAAYLLSRYHPTSDELPLALNGSNENAYQLVAVAGWLRSPDGAAQRRKRVFLVAEGSVISPPHLPAGDVCNVRPTYDTPSAELPHPIYRYGLALSAAWRPKPERS